MLEESDVPIGCDLFLSRLSGAHERGLDGGHRTAFFDFVLLFETLIDLGKAGAFPRSEY